MRRRLLSGLIIALFFPFLAQAQFTKIARSNQQWMQYNGQFTVVPKFRVQFDAGFRTKNWFQEPNTYLIRIAANYEFIEHWRIGVGFAHFGALSDTAFNQIEYRPHIDFMFDNMLRSAKFENRLRIEDRIIKDRITDEKLPNVVRFRYRFQLSAPIISFSKTHPERKLLFLLGDEILLNAGKDVKYNVFGQNRFTVGPGFQINEGLVIGIQYGYFWGTTNAEASYRQDNILWLTIRHNVDFTKGKTSGEE